MIERERIVKLLHHQLNNYWFDIDYSKIDDCLTETLDDIKKDFSKLSSNYIRNGCDIIFNPMHSTTWCVFLYKLSRQLYLSNYIKEATAVYYLNKVMHSVDWFYDVGLPVHFMAEHPLGSVLGKAKYGDYLFVYQGTTVGGNWNNNKLNYPIIGENVILYANATVLGKTRIGKNVVVSANSYLINEVVPDNCIVFGKSPDIIVRKKTKEEILNMTSHIWSREHIDDNLWRA